tara:strand:+ start:1848 stop:1961 length:114 start_codon:yes stop_codon:yes gene_type:complete
LEKCIWYGILKKVSKGKVDVPVKKVSGKGGRYYKKKN